MKTEDEELEALEADLLQTEKELRELAARDHAEIRMTDEATDRLKHSLDAAAAAGVSSVYTRRWLKIAAILTVCVGGTMYAVWEDDSTSQPSPLPSLAQVEGVSARAVQTGPAVQPVAVSETAKEAAYEAECDEAVIVQNTAEPEPIVRPAAPQVAVSRLVATPAAEAAGIARHWASEPAVHGVAVCRKSNTAEPAVMGASGLAKSPVRAAKCAERTAQPVAEPGESIKPPFTVRNLLRQLLQGSWQAPEQGNDANR